MPGTTLPKYLYKYQPLTMQTLENLSAGQLWAASPASFNDPFDCAAARIDAKLETVEQFLLEVGAQRSPARAQADVVRELLPQLVQSASIAAKAGGVVCLSRKCNDILMWSHYAEGHTGICLKFDSSQGLFKAARRVVYFHEMPRWNFEDVVTPEPPFFREDLKKALYLTKYEDWNYEDEWRIVANEGDRAITYPPDALRAIYVACRQTESQSKILHGVSPVPLFKMEAGATGFDLKVSEVPMTAND